MSGCWIDPCSMTKINFGVYGLKVIKYNGRERRCGMNEILVKNIESYCRANNITIKEFAERCGFDNSTVNRWREGASPTLRVLVEIQKATGIGISKWIGEAS